jgi:bifunctional DNA-binding transcriptional regulator/antitoxin component of YhaV-PrlF toxin-antitoxin module
MSKVVIDDEYRIVLPDELRDPELIRPGREVEVALERGAIRVRPVRTLKELKGAFPGVSSDFREERDREWRN